MISANVMVRNEPFIYFALKSIEPFVNEFLICDTGSTDETVSDIESFIKESKLPVKFEQVHLEDAHGWKLNDLDNTVNHNVSKNLGDIRRKLHNNSLHEWIWILDGDEVYPYALADFCSELTNKVTDNIDAIFPGFLDLMPKDKLGSLLDKLVDEHSKYDKDVHNVKTHRIRHKHYMGRLFRKNTVECVGNYPTEMHRNKNSSIDLSPGQQNTLTITPKRYSEYVFHFESIIKPWRKAPHEMIGETDGFLPEVFNRYVSRFEKLRLKYNI